MEPIKASGEWIVTYKNGIQRYFVYIGGKKQQIARARLVMMNFLHTKNIPLCFDIHHRDKDSLNDDIDNLLLISHSDHGKLHHQKDYKFGVSSSDDKLEYDKRRRNSSPEQKAMKYANSRRYIEENREKTLLYNKQYNKKYCEENKEILKEKRRIRREEKRKNAITSV